MPLQIDLKNKVALITGVTSGIGAGVAKMFAKAGANVVGCGTSDPDSDEVKNFTKIVTEQDQESLYRTVDVTNKDALEQLIAAAANKFGRIDILVSNAGKNFFEGVAECTKEKWKKNMELNLTAHWYLAKLCKPYLDRANPGVIILMASNHAFQTLPGCFPYNVTKTALTGLVRSLAIEWGPKIRTVGLAPGFIDTPGNQKWFDSFDDPNAERKRTLNLHPVKRIGSTLEVGTWCAFLASEYAAFASGTTYLLDGGRSALMQDDI